jgi:hypothetical protein
MRTPQLRRPLTVVIATLTATAASILFTVSAASAATGSSRPELTHQPNHLVKKTAAMKKVRVVRLISGKPDQAGQVKVQLANGSIVPIPQAAEKKVMSRAAQEAAQPDGTVYGNCGSSYITLMEKPDGYPVAMQTGFTVVEPAIGYDWSASVTGPDYSFNYESSGGLFFDSSWNGGYQSSQDQATGIYLAEVDPAGSDAILLDGTVCVSGGPVDAEYLTVPMAACLKNEPALAVASGTGWISNTTQPVAHRNKTTNPPGPAGVRPTLATACLTRSLGAGSAASGNITGWRDAQLFVATFAPGTAIARCHLIAQVLGGKGGTLDGGQANLVPCWQVGVNTGTPSMRTYEAQVQAAVASLPGNDAVYYQVTPDYLDATSTIPWAITLSATVEHANGTTQPLFSGIPVVNTSSINGLNLGN